MAEEQDDKPVDNPPGSGQERQASPGRDLIGTSVDSQSESGQNQVTLSAGEAGDFQAPEPGTNAGSRTVDAQDNFVESREPVELIFCVILSAAYLGLARWCANLVNTKYWPVLGFFITIGMLSLLLGLRPYLSPSNLQISKHGLKYRGPYWPQRKTVNWSQIARMYLSPELMIVLYHLPDNPKAMRVLLVHTVYLADSGQISESIAKYSTVTPIMLSNPGFMTRIVQYGVFLALAMWILYLLLD